MREEGPTGSRFCSGDLNLQSSGQKSCRQLITDRVRHVQMKSEPSFNRKERNQIFFGLRRESRRAGATPLWKLYPQSKSGVAAALCHRSPKSSRFSKILTDSSAERKKLGILCVLCVPCG